MMMRVWPQAVALAARAHTMCLLDPWCLRWGTLCHLAWLTANLARGLARPCKSFRATVNALDMFYCTYT